MRARSPNLASTLTGLGLLAMVSACATAGPSGGPPAIETPASSAPSPVDGLDWHLTPDGDTARLAYGAEASDHLELGFDCQAGSGDLAITATGPRGAREIHLESGGETERFQADGEPSELHDGDLLTAEASAAEPVFKRFRQLGWIAAWVEGRRETYVPHPGARDDVERFFAFCG